MTDKQKEVARFIRRNLRAHGLNDLCIDLRAPTADLAELASEAGVGLPSSFATTDETVVLERDVRLSRILALGRVGLLIPKLDPDPNTKLKYPISSILIPFLIYQNQEQIGSVEPNHSFFKYLAGSLRAAIGWAICSDLGRRRDLLVDLDKFVDLARRRARGELGITEFSGHFKNGEVTWADSYFPMSDLAHEVACREAGLTYIRPNYQY